jgi:hypothetical protein
MAETMVTGYNYMEDGTFSGEYKFPKNNDGNPIHVPPFTTLVPPPFVPAGKKAMWNGMWNLVDITLPQWLIDYDFPPPANFEWPFINRMKAAGVYALFVHAYFLRGLITVDDTVYFDSLIKAGDDQRIADRLLAKNTIPKVG